MLARSMLRLAGIAALALAAPAAAAPGPEARALIDEAIGELRANHVNRANVDWPALTRRAYEMADNAVTPRDAHPAIRHVISALGERHTMFFPAPDPAQPRERPLPRQRRDLAQPAAARLQGGVGYIRIPAWPFARDNARSEEWVRRTRDRIAAIDGDGVCGWVVDVRGNGGGNMWPMLDVLGPLLGAPPFGTLVSQTRAPILYERGRAFYPGLEPAMPPLPELRLRSAAAPVAVLMDEETGSSGESVVMAFRGRSRTRTFGERTANYVSMNNPRTLSDGSVITTTVGYTEDRTGYAYRDAIEPDERGEGEAVLETARAWAAREGRCG